MLLKEKRLKDIINKVCQSKQVEVADLASNVVTTTVTLVKNTVTPQKEKTKSPSQLTAEALVESQNVALLTEDNAKRTLELQAIETNTRNEESKRNDTFILTMLERFDKKDPTEEFIAEKKKIEAHRSDLGDEVTDAKISKITKRYLGSE